MDNKKNHRKLDGPVSKGKSNANRDFLERNVGWSVEFFEGVKKEWGVTLFNMFGHYKIPQIAERIYMFKSLLQELKIHK